MSHPHTHRGTLEGREALGRASSVASFACLKEGYLLKQSDHFLEWRVRYFELEDDVLSYWIPERDDHVPKGSRQLPKGTKVTDGGERSVGSVTYYIFKIEHASIYPSYRLATESKEKRSAWTMALKTAIAGERYTRISLADARSFSSGDLTDTSTTSIMQEAPELNLPERGMRRLIGSGNMAQVSRRNITEGAASNSAAVVLNGRVHLTGVAAELEAPTLAGIPPEYLEDTNKAAATLIQAVTPRAEGWEAIVDRDGVFVSKKAAPDGAICFRAMATIPFTIAEIFAASYTTAARKALDSELQECRRLRWFSRHTGVEYLSFRPILPANGKQYCNLTHWRLQEDGAFVSLAFSVPFPEQYLEDHSVVPSQLLLDGYVMRPVVGGTNVYHIVQTDLVKLSSYYTTKAAEEQASTLFSLRRRLECIHAGEDRPLFTRPIPNSYDGIPAFPLYTSVA